jgi:hypothetical protein
LKRLDTAKFYALAGHLVSRPEADAIAFLSGWEAAMLHKEEGEQTDA